MADTDVHAHGKLSTAGPPPETARLTLVLVHGRGASAEGMLSLLDELGLDDVAAVAPQAVGNSWYPQSFLAPLAANQPYLDSALLKIETVIADLGQRGVPAERIALLGFSQGACLTTEFVARHPRRYAGVMGLSGGLIGPPGTPRYYPGSLEATPVFLGCGDPDMHIPFDRVRETEATLARMGATVDARRYPGLPHTVNADEINACRALLRQQPVSPDARATDL